MKKIAIFAAGLLIGVNATALANSALFTDEDQFANWNRDAIHTMNNNGIMTGFEDGSFGPNEPVTRAQLAVILDRFEQERIPAGIDTYVKNAQDSAPEAANLPSTDDDAVLGDENAPITMIQFCDYQGPFCEKVYRDVLPLIKENYIEKGLVKLVYRDFPLPFHENAKSAAMAAECVRAQGGDESYFSYHNLLFENQNNLSTESLKNMAADLVLSQDDFDNCLDNETYAGEVEKDMADGQTVGVKGTPYFFINDKMISGAQPYASFETVIEAELNNQWAAQQKGFAPEYNSAPSLESLNLNWCISF